MNITELKVGDRVRYNTEYSYPQVHEGTGTIEGFHDGQVSVMNDRNHWLVDGPDYIQPENIYEVLPPESRHIILSSPLDIL